MAKPQVIIEPSANPRISSEVRQKLDTLKTAVERYHENDSQSATVLYQASIRLLQEVGML